MVNFFCPTREQVATQLLALLPRGRAWQTSEGLPDASRFGGFNENGFSDAFAHEKRTGSILRQFWDAVSETFYFINQRLCALNYEFWCATRVETDDQWLVEYGLPDPCDPFPDLCVKVAALGGTRCEYYAYIAQRHGWAITCISDTHDCGTMIGCASALVGRTMPGKSQSAIIRILVDLNNSPSFSGTSRQLPMAGRFMAGNSFSCPADISPLQCILERIVHAEIEINYEVY